jgi:hypothetical protein
MARALHWMLPSISQGGYNEYEEGFRDFRIPADLRSRVWSRFPAKSGTKEKSGARKK